MTVCDVGNFNIEGRWRAVICAACRVAWQQARVSTYTGGSGRGGSGVLYLLW